MIRSMRFFGGKADTQKKMRKDSFSKRMDRRVFNWNMRSAFYRHMASKMGNGVTEIDAVRLFQGRMKRRKRSTMMKIMMDVARRMHNGAPLSRALETWIPADESMVLVSGEQAGNLPIMFELVIESKQRQRRVVGALKSAMMEPAILTVMLFVMLWVIGTFAIPALEQAYPADRATGFVAFLYASSGFATSYWAFLPLGVMAIMMFIAVKSLPTLRGPLRLRLESLRFIPLWSFYRDINGYVWLLGFASMLRAGVSDTLILKQQIRLANPWLTERLRLLRRHLINGAKLGVVIANARINGRALDFPSPDMADEIASLSGFEDFPVRIVQSAQEWAIELEREMLAKAKMLGFYVKFLIYGAIASVIVGIMQFSMQIGSITGQ